MPPQGPPPHREDGEERWLYYCTLVPGYVEKYGFRGMRERNAKLLQELKSKNRERAEREIFSDLTENNLPLAMYVAKRWSVNHGLGQEQLMDDFQECCAAMFLYLATHDVKTWTVARLQISLYWAAKHPLYATRDIPEAEYIPGHVCTLENTHRRVPFNEEDFPCEEEPREGVNEPFLRKMVNHALGQKNARRLLAWYLGDEKRRIEPFNIDDLSFHERMTNEGLMRNIHKSEEKLRKFISSLIRQHYFQKEDFITTTYPDD